MMNPKKLMEKKQNWTLVATLATLILSSSGCGDGGPPPPPPPVATVALQQPLQASGTPALFVGTAAGARVTQVAGDAYSHNQEWTQDAIDLAIPCGTELQAAVGGMPASWSASGFGRVAAALLGDAVGTTFISAHRTTLPEPTPQVIFGQPYGTSGGDPNDPGAGVSTGCHEHVGCVNAEGTVPCRVCARIDSADAAVSCKPIGEIKEGQYLHWGGFNARPLVEQTLAAFLDREASLGRALPAGSDAVVTQQGDLDRVDIDLTGPAAIVGAYSRLDRGGAKGARNRYVRAWWAWLEPGEESAWVVASLAPWEPAAETFDAALARNRLTPASLEALEVWRNWEAGWGPLGNGDWVAVARAPLDMTAVALTVWDRETNEWDDWRWEPRPVE